MRKLIVISSLSMLNVISIIIILIYDNLIPFSVGLPMQSESESQFPQNIALAPDPSLTLISSTEYDESENEIFSDEPDKTLSEQKPMLQLPSYLVEKVGESLDEFEVESETTTLARVWLPSEIKENPISLDTEARLLFQQEQDMGNFTRAELVLTLSLSGPLAVVKEGVDMGSLMLENAGNFQDEHSLRNFNFTLPISRHKKYYKFDLTSTLKNILVLSNKIFIDMKLSSKTYPLESIFDLQVDRPFILFRYGSFPHPRKLSRKSRPKSRKSRSKRSLKEATEKTAVPSHLCQRYEWEVDPVRDLQWDKVITPRRIELGFCAGKCPVPLGNEMFNYTFHTLFVDRFKLNKFFQTPYNFPVPCCVPVGYKPLTAWTQEDGSSLVQRVYKDSVVDQCGCR